MKIYLSWADFKVQVVEKAKLRFIDRDTFYLLTYEDFECSVDKDGGSAETDFETNYKTYANKTSTPAIGVITTPPYGSKTINVNGVVKKLYARNVGFQQALTTGANTIAYTATYPWAKLLGVEVVNCEALDMVDFKVFDDANGTYSTVPNALLNQFSYSHNLPKDYYLRMSQFDADLYAGMVISITYTSVSGKTVGINLIMNEVKN